MPTLYTPGSTDAMAAAHAAAFLSAETHALPRRHRVLLVEDHDLVRMGVKALFGPPDFAEIDWIEAPTLDDALHCGGRQGEIDAILLDLNLSDCKGLHGLAAMREANVGVPVLILSGTQDEFVVRQAKAMGASGYLFKGSPPAQMREALRAVLQRGASGSCAAAPHGFAKPAARTSFDRVDELGPRHLEILELVLSGCTNQEISTSTKLSLGTVKNYVSTILLALDVKSRSHLISLFR
jgi:DNA-binding NarL/FixJ family response regulator